MKKRCAFILMLLLMLLLTSCRVKGKYPFLHSTDDIKEISIVEVSDGGMSGLSENELKIIENNSEFLDDFQKLNCYINLGEPVGAIAYGKESDIVIKILYDQGEYEYINWCGQSRYTDFYEFKYYMGRRFFEEDQFEEFIDKVLDAE